MVTFHLYIFFQFFLHFGKVNSENLRGNAITSYNVNKSEWEKRYKNFMRINYGIEVRLDERELSMILQQPLNPSSICTSPEEHYVSDPILPTPQPYIVYSQPTPINIYNTASASAAAATGSGSSNAAAATGSGSSNAAAATGSGSANAAAATGSGSANAAVATGSGGSGAAISGVSNGEGTSKAIGVAGNPSGASIGVEQPGDTSSVSIGVEQPLIIEESPTNTSFDDESAESTSMPTEYIEFITSANEYMSSATDVATISTADEFAFPWI